MSESVFEAGISAKPGIQRLELTHNINEKEIRISRTHKAIRSLQTSQAKWANAANDASNADIADVDWRCWRMRHSKAQYVLSHAPLQKCAWIQLDGIQP